MATPKKYTHDRIILLLLSIVTFIGVGNSLVMALRLLNSQNNSYIIQYRSSLGLNAFRSGSVENLAAFIVFMLLAVVAAYVLSRRIYPLRRHLAIIVLIFSATLLAFASVVGNVLLGLR